MKLSNELEMMNLFFLLHQSNQSTFYKLNIFLTGLVIILVGTCQGYKRGVNPEDIKHGYVSKLQASKWEESMLTGNGEIGALVLGYPNQERIVYSHERLFLPLYPPAEAPNLKKVLPEIRKNLLSGNAQKAADLMMEAGEEAGIVDMIWTDPLIPACQMEIENLNSTSILNYQKSVNYENGEAKVQWNDGEQTFTRKVFASRADDLIVMQIEASKGKAIDIKMRLAQVPFEIEEDEEDEDEDEDEEEEDEDEDEEEEELNIEEVLESETYEVANNQMRYAMTFKKEWEGSLRGVETNTELSYTDGKVSTDGEWLYITGASKILTYTKIELTFSEPKPKTDNYEILKDLSYAQLLDRHAEIHGEMFNRFSLQLSRKDMSVIDYDELYANRNNGELDPKLVQQLLESCRYILISSTGELPPSLQGIWGGTWLPNWSGDFTLNGNVPSAISSGMNTNFQEVIEAYIGYLSGFINDFRQNAEDIHGASGIFMPSRSSSSGKTYHFGEQFPHLFWYTGNAWASQYFYDFWQYSRDEETLREVIIPFMLESMTFYEDVLYQSETGQYMFVPSYSPEVGPLDGHPLAINATMDVGALKQLIRNLLKLVELGFVKTDKQELWESILENLPKYQISKDGDLKEWLWDGFENDNRHRHASHLYPLYFETDPEFAHNPDLKEAASTAIEKRLQYRRDNQGSEMAFGLVQLGLAAAHILDVEHAYECVEWLCRSYWSPAYTSYHDPGAIFNTDICGGLPALVTEMLVQSSATEITLLPALPNTWEEGQIRGALTRSGVQVDLEWKNRKVTRLVMTTLYDTEIIVNIHGIREKVSLRANERKEIKLNE